MAYTKALSKEQRIKVYCEALRTFRRMAAQKAHQKSVTGMCLHIHEAIIKLKYNRIVPCSRVFDYLYEHDLNRKNFPEYFSFKPKSNFKLTSGYSPSRYTDYWWSIKTPNGREKRIAIMEALAEGKSKGE